MTIDERKTINTAVVQNLILENRGKLSISGVLDVLSFDDQVIMVETELGLLTIKGENLRITKLSIDTSEVIVEGNISYLAYSNKEVEKNKYNEWVNKGYFKGDKDKSRESFCIVIPPPNVTGKLHLGHAWDTTLQDIIIRYKRMCGYDALWLPGMDHAGIATQAKVDKRLREMGINPRGITRDEWLEHAWSWKDEYATTIHEQWAKLGLSLDYTKERFTLDEGLSKAVRYVFVKLYEKGLIYRGERIINWDPVQMTALSNEEVIYKEDKGAFYHIKYYITGTDEYLDVATTRPETLFGDTAVAVNPSDDRYKHLIGKTVILPIVNKEIPIVGDYHADPEFGTGCVKTTPNGTSPVIIRVIKDIVMAVNSIFNIKRKESVVC